MLTGLSTDPQVTALHRRLDRLRELRGPAVPDACAQVREVVVVASSSRSGSSMLAEVLRGCDALLHLRAEINPFLRLAGLGFPDSGSGSDLLDAGHLESLPPLRRRMLDAELALEIGNPADEVADKHRFGLDVAWRLTVQWPEHDWTPEEVAGLAVRALHRLGRERAGGPPDWTRYRELLLQEVRAAGYPVDPSRYDGAQPAGAATGPPGELLVEEPPFVPFGGWRHAGAEDLRSRPLVVKSPSNAYRLGFLRALFPHARLRVLHLTRNPAASINGLYDGWRHRGFHAHRMPEPLDIAGYTDVRPQDRMWWKFDLPPGWSAYTAAPLPQVCAFQWRTCHRWILDALGVADDHLRLRFEDLIGPPAVRQAAFGRLAGWLGIPAEPLRRVADEGVAPMSATVPPAPGRWRQRASLIGTALDERVRSVAEELGYGADDEWI